MQKVSKRTASPDEVSVFCEQIALMLAAGMALHDGVEALIEGYRDTRDFDKYKRISERVNETGVLADALRESGLFPQYMVEMTAIGERAGKLEWVMRGLSEYYQREGKVNRSIRNAILYPMVLLIMMACVIAILMTRVLPIFEQVFASMGMDMSASASALMSVGMNIGYAVLIVAGALVLIALVMALMFKLGKRDSIMKLLFRISPAARRLSGRIAGSKFANVMSMMMASGFPLEEAIEVAPTIMTDDNSRNKLIQLGKRMGDGLSFPDALAETEMFDPLYSRMIRMGFMSGQADAALSKIAGIYEEEVDDGFAKLVSTIEPTLVALLSVIIGAILLSVMLPMASILSGII